MGRRRNQRRYSRVSRPPGDFFATVVAERDAFRTAIGGGTVAGANGSFGGPRRETGTACPTVVEDPTVLPNDFFNVNSPRGLVLSIRPASGSW